MADSRVQEVETHVATCLGVRVPESPFLNERRIERINAAEYEGQEIAGALHVVRKGDRILELGAGLGIVGAVVAHNGAPERVMSFEANPNLIPHIDALYQMNGLQDRISVTNRVLMPDADRPETASFFVSRSYLGSSLTDKANRATEEIAVATQSLEETMRDLKPQVILMDIEGGELEVLRHADLTGVRAMVVEFHPESYGIPGMRTCKNILREAGFERIETHSSRTVWTCARDI